MQRRRSSFISMQTKRCTNNFSPTKCLAHYVILKSTWVDIMSLLFVDFVLQVAIICNHQRSVSKSHDVQMSRLSEKMKELQVMSLMTMSPYIMNYLECSVWFFHGTIHAMHNILQFDHTHFYVGPCRFPFS